MNAPAQWPPLPSEVLMAFLAWLTTRKETLILGASHLVPPAIEAWEQFCKANNFVKPRDGFVYLFAWPGDNGGHKLTPHEATNMPWNQGDN